MYMLVAAQEGVAELGGDQVDFSEYKFTKWENIARAKKLGVENLPSIYISGQLHFSSPIPSQEALIAAIQGYLV